MLQISKLVHFLCYKKGIVLFCTVPADVALISIKKYGSASITVGWDSPPVGSYSGLLVSWQAANSPTVTTIWIDKILSQHAIQGLGSGVTFNITIQATNGAKTSKGKSISQTTGKTFITFPVCYFLNYFIL